MPDTSTPEKAREHARAQAGIVSETMPTVPASSAKNLPPGINPDDVIWDETIPAGGYASRIVPRGTRLRMTNLKGDSCANVLVYNADQTAERLNVADTIKVQWNGYLGEGKLLLSDMGRVLMTIVRDTCGKHDVFCGASNPKTIEAKYGSPGVGGSHVSARERFMLAMAKHGMERRDVMPNINFFKGVKIERDGSTTFDSQSSKPGDFVELRAEMNVLIVIANTPHLLDPRKEYLCTPLRLTAWRGEITKSGDVIRESAPENVRAFENVDEYFSQIACGAE